MQTEYAQRREQLMAKLGKGTAIFRSAPMAVMHNDVEYNFRRIIYLLYPHSPTYRSLPSAAD
ncbi:aminopeptidase P N-terminal domain-containing protein [Leptolyngbya sp. 7M]|uniref:aminopeptidase P N-terminal domain-containing protein n=1 Tax=Leptolyngbya sp. 7M TaxID=2812896 RepID=UPI0021F0D19E|nr:aminopeptidase P N-terminal domain-containing protein [Leptolyngbya sp. 7M]